MIDSWPELFSQATPKLLTHGYCEEYTKLTVYGTEV